MCEDDEKTAEKRRTNESVAAFSTSRVSSEECHRSRLVRQVHARPIALTLQGDQTGVLPGAIHELRRTSTPYKHE